MAIKIIRSRKRFLQQGLIEVKLLEHLRKQASKQPHLHNQVYYELTMRAT